MKDRDPRLGEQGVALIATLVMAPLVLLVFAGLALLSLALHARLRLDYRCREEVLTAQNELAKKLNGIESLNERILLVHQAYLVAKAGRAFPPTSPWASTTAATLLALKIALDRELDLRTSHVRVSLLGRTSRAAANLSKSIGEDFALQSRQDVVVAARRPRLRILKVERLDEHSKRMLPTAELPNHTELQWRWQWSPHTIVPDTTLSFLRRTLSTESIRERLRAEGGLHLLRGECSAHLNRGADGLWRSFLGRDNVSWSF